MTDAEKHKENIVNNLVGIKFEGRPIPLWDEKDKLTDKMKQFKVPGLSIVVINDFQIDWTLHEGVQDLNSNKKLTPETLFEAASTTKALTAVLALHFVENGILDLDEEINTKLKNWKIPENEFTEKEKVTLRRLLTHMAGINRPDSLFSYEEGKTPTLIQVLNGESPALNDPVKVEFIPGSKHQYSNIGYTIIQQLLEDVTGKSFHQLMKEVIFEPLEMNNSTLEFPLPDNFSQRAVLPHTAKGEAKDKGLHASALAHGNLSCTSIDLSKFLLELMNTYNGKSEKILSKNMVRKMFESQRSFGPTELMGFSDQALGVFLMRNDKNSFFLHPGGNEPGANCFLIGSPTTGHGAILMSNGSMGELINMQLIYTIAKDYEWNFG
ncbi:MAG: beta-lactamase family protein [Candidatus Heimdallarchaeota archaeon]